ncbi:hypothetical protein [Nitratidesulfovibrio termitidis]|uniref:hypothetical protein n=1 Tax=Nitratidesulfovibrio termitidis TaxID=42252 RepID=UPI00040E73E5|nr:hypothetical protein [Nitratidesulfovibrio termitidis]
MAKSIYILTTLTDQGMHRATVTQFRGRDGFAAYANKVLSRTNTHIPSDATVEEICDALYNTGPGLQGARSHRRISRRESEQAIRDGARNDTQLMMA